MSQFRFSHTPIDAAAETNRVRDIAAGGFASFEGWVRNHNEGREVLSLTYEAFEALAISEGEKIITEAKQRFNVLQAYCVHRVGDCPLGEMAVWVGASAPHRAEAFAACRYIIDEVKHRIPIWKKEFYRDGDSGWVNCERCAQPSAHNHTHNHAHQHSHAPIQLNNSQINGIVARQPDYSRQIALKAVGAGGQAKLKGTRILVIGAGGLGVPTALYLAGAGVGVIGIMDGDVIEPSNLHRQPIYTLADVGKSKALCLKTHLNALNPEVDVRFFNERASLKNLPTLALDYDLLIDCTDNFGARFLIHDVARALNKPLVAASVYQYEGQIQTIIPTGACLRCLWPNTTRDGLVGNCQEVGVLGPVPGVLGALQALEAIKWCVGLASPLTSHLALFDLLNYQTHTIAVPQQPNCLTEHRLALTQAHLETHSRLELTLTEFMALKLEQTIIDIRDAEERSQNPLTLPHQAVVAKELIANATNHISHQTATLLVCARGVRSKALATELRANGFEQVYSLVDGVTSTNHYR